MNQTPTIHYHILSVGLMNQTPTIHYHILSVGLMNQTPTTAICTIFQQQK